MTAIPPPPPGTPPASSVPPCHTSRPLRSARLSPVGTPQKSVCRTNSQCSRDNSLVIHVVKNAASPDGGVDIPRYAPASTDWDEDAIPPLVSPSLSLSQLRQSINVDQPEGAGDAAMAVGIADIPVRTMSGFQEPSSGPSNETCCNAMTMMLLEDAAKVSEPSPTHHSPHAFPKLHAPDPPQDA